MARNVGLGSIRSIIVHPTASTGVVEFSVPLRGTFHTRNVFRRRDVLGRNKSDKNLSVTTTLSNVDGNFNERQLMFLGETADVFKRFLGVFGSYNKRGKRVKRTP